LVCRLRSIEKIREMNELTSSQDQETNIQLRSGQYTKFNLARNSLIDLKNDEFENNEFIVKQYGKISFVVDAQPVED